MKKKLFLMIALLCAVVQGAWAQASLDEVYAMTNTTAANWTQLSAGSTTGKTLGTANATTYYYADANLSFTNSMAGGSGLTILGTVYLYVPQGVTVTCTGANANGATGGGAGIELTAGNFLNLLGSGSVNATGGNAANGGNGGNGNNAECTYDESILGGSGGTGGNGGGGAGAGIGTCGGNGGTGGTGGQRNGSYGQETTQYGVDGNAGSGGSTAGPMGTLYKTNDITVNATGGSAGSNGTGGNRGLTASQHPGSNVYMASGGGGGGAGGFGGAATGIGTGGPGGGGGGGGAAGNSAWAAYDFYRVGAGGGKGGLNADGSNASDGVTSELTSMHDAEYKSGFDGDDSFTDKGWESGNGMHSGGSGGSKGGDAAVGTTNAGEKTYTITLQPTRTKVNGSNLNPVTMTYTPSTLTTFILPKNKSGYQWALLVYGKSCKADGTAGSVFTTATKEFFGGEEEDDALRTIMLNDVYGDMTFIEVASTCKLKSSGDNSETLTDFFYNEAILSQKYPVTVRLQNRTLYTDDKYNTLCLPFGMTPSQFDISILQGATIYEMNTTDTGYYPDGTLIPDPMHKKEGPVLYLKFDYVNASTNGLEAGKPYLVKWTSGTNFVDNTSKGNTRHEVDFYNVTVTKLAPQAPAANGVTFQGTFSSSATLTAGDKTKLILGADNKLYYPSKNINVGACRAYFIIPAAAASAREVVMGFDDGETTSIKVIQGSGLKDHDSDTYFNLNGQRLSAPQKGINIVNGKKVIIK